VTAVLRLADQRDERDAEELVNYDAEQGVLSVILRHNQTYAEVASYLKAEHFHDTLHGRIFDACGRAIETGQIASPITLKNVFDQDQALVSIGGAKYLRDLAGFAFPPSAADDFAGIVLNLARKRGLLQIAKDLREAALDPEREAESVAAEIGANIMTAVTPRASWGGGSAYELALEVVAAAQGEQVFFSTGLAGLDRAMGGGLMPGSAYGFRAPTKAGKTVLAGTIAFNLNMSSVPSLYLAFEMKPRQLARRNLARQLGINGMALLPGASPLLLARAANVAMTTPPHAQYEPMAGRTLDDAKRLIAEHVVSTGIKGVFVDYLQLMRGQERQESRADFLERASYELVALCGRHDLWCVLLAQVNREGETRGGDGMNFAVDQLYTLYREDPYPEAALKMELTRDTPYCSVGSVDDAGKVTAAGLRFNKHGPHFEDAGYFAEVAAA
jgi:replicative DNA helicase